MRRELKYQILNAKSKVLVEGVMSGRSHEILGTSSFPLSFRILCHRRRVLVSLKCVQLYRRYMCVNTNSQDLLLVLKSTVQE